MFASCYAGRPQTFWMDVAIFTGNGLDCLQCLDTVGWASETEEHPVCKKIE